MEMTEDIKKKKDEIVAAFLKSTSSHVGDPPDPENVKSAVNAALETHPLAVKAADVKMSADGQSLEVQLNIPVNTVEVTFTVEVTLDVGPDVEKRLEELAYGQPDDR